TPEKSATWDADQVCGSAETMWAGRRCRRPEPKINLECTLGTGWDRGVTAGDGGEPPDALGCTNQQNTQRGRVRQRHSVCLAAHVSGGFKSRSARGPGPISQGGGHAAPAHAGGREGDASTGTQAKAGKSPGGPGATSSKALAGRASTGEVES